jgi:hypothetical protein
MASRKSRIQASRKVAILRDAIEAERGRLTKAESLLGCLAISMEYEDCSGQNDGPYYPDVAQVACDLIRQTIDGLDSVNLDLLIRRAKVKEEFGCVAIRSTMLPGGFAMHDGDVTYWERLLRPVSIDEPRREAA